MKNSTDDLKVRVTLLENDVSNLQDDVEEVETDNNLQDERLNTMEIILNENGNDIDGKYIAMPSVWYFNLIHPAGTSDDNYVPSNFD